MLNPTYRFWVLLALLFSSVAASTAQKMPKIYAQEFSDLDSLIERSFYKESLAEADKMRIKLQADRRNPFQKPLLFKNMLYRFNISQELVEEKYKSNITFLENELPAWKGVYKAILELLLARAYNDYVDSQYQNILVRTPLKDSIPKDIAFWSLNNFNDKIESLLKRALSEPSLKESSVKDYWLILKPNYYNELFKSIEFAPTIYDVFVYHIIDFYKNDRYYIQHVREEYEMNMPEVFAPAAEFMKQRFNAIDSNARKFKILLLYRDQTLAYSSDSSFWARHYLDLQRLDFCYEESSHPDKDSLYEAALNQIVAANPKHELAAIAKLRIADLVYKNAKDADDLKKVISLCEEALRDGGTTSSVRYPAESLIEVIKTKSLGLNFERVIPSHKPWLIALEYRNIKFAQLKIYALDNALEQSYEDSSTSERYQMLNALTPIYTEKIALPDAGDFNKHSVESIFPAMPAGRYWVCFSENLKIKESEIYVLEELWVSDLSLLLQGSDYDNTAYFLDREDGQPIADVDLHLVQRMYDRETERYIDSIVAKVKVPNSGTLKANAAFYSSDYRLYKGRDSLYLSGFSSYNNYFGEVPIYTNIGQTSTFAFLDREIYRPGQTLYFKGILTEKAAGRNFKVQRDSFVSIGLCNVYGTLISQIKLPVNEYGSFHGKFDIPNNVLTGEFSLRMITSSNDYNNAIIKKFRVEDYKRPSFEVVFEETNSSFILDDSVTVVFKAKTYSAANLNQAKVSYSIHRISKSNSWGYEDGYTELGSGNTLTDEKGEVRIRFFAKSSKENGITASASDFEIKVDITDQSGETHSAKKRMNIARKPLIPILNLAKHYEKSANLQIPFVVNNTNNSAVSVNVSFKLELLRSPQKVHTARLWEIPDFKPLVYKADFNRIFPQFAYSRQEEEIDNWSVVKTLETGTYRSDTAKTLNFNSQNWEQGVYRLSIEANDTNGNRVELQQHFTLIDPKMSAIPTMEALFINEALTKRGLPGDTILFDIGGIGAENGIIFILEQGGKILQREFLTGKSRYKLSIVLDESHQGGLHYHFTTVRNNRVYSKTGAIEVPWDYKKLDIEIANFRDKLQPGEREELQIKIKGRNKDRVMAELLATMYDASLDAFRPNNWYYNLYGYSYSRVNLQKRGFGLLMGSDYESHYYSGVPPLAYGIDFAYFGPMFYWSYYKRHHQVFYKGKLLNYGANEEYEVIESMGGATGAEEAPLPPPPPPPPPMPAPAPVAEAEIFSLNRVGKNFPNQLNEEEQNFLGNTVDIIRRNLSETVFFYPQLQTDKEGNVLLKFKMNDALTRWRLMLFAHTKDMKTGYEEAYITTQKDLMVIPNLPRFLRQGDTLFFSVKVMNLREKNIKGQAMLQILDAATEEPINDAFAHKNRLLPFDLKGNASTALSWKLAIPNDFDKAVLYRIVVKSGNLSDGEQGLLPVLSNRTLVTESMPLPINGGETKTFEFKRMAELSKSSSTFRHHKYSLEFTQNPAWYAIQSMPYLMEYPYECSEQLFSRLYANSLASFILNSHPKIKATFEQWNKADIGSFEAALHTNSELKSVLLEETPWVLDAKNEAQKQKNLALLFDLNRMAKEKEEAIKKLSARQGKTGGFSWFPGGHEDWYITQHIVAGMGHLKRLGVRFDYYEEKTSNSALLFCGNALVASYKDKIINSKIIDKDSLYRYLEQDHLSSMAIHYLYASSFFENKKTPQGLDSVLIYYHQQAKKYWQNQSIYMQGMLALALYRADKNNPTVALIVKSLRERSIETAEMGMYWPSRSGCYWYEAPIETHVLLMEVFAEIANDSAAVDKMKLWLLKNKQSKNWATTKATTAACYALLSTGDNWLLEDKDVQIQVGKEKLAPSKLGKEGGTGYFKVEWDASKINNEMARVKVENPNKNVAWGAVYWQYFEQLDKVTDFKETLLKINKKLYKKLASPNGPVLEQIDGKNNTLATGDLVTVRIELTVGQDMEYVHMKDQRASGFEPVNVLSQYKYQGGIGYYESTRDAASNFFIDYLRKGTYVFEYELRVSQRGDFSNGITTIQCMYAPEFTSHSEGVRVKVE